MAERFKMTDIIAAALAGKPQEAQQTPERPSTPPPQPEAPQRPASERRRPIGQTHTREVHAGLVVGSRQAQRDARAYAEAWWQALREWHIRTASALVIGGGPRRSGGGRMEVVGVGNWGGAPWGGVLYTRVQTPIGEVSETMLAQAITRHGGPLERVRNGGGLATLVDPRGGWASPKSDALKAAAAVLALAHSLGDEKAGMLSSTLEMVE